MTETVTKKIHCRLTHEGTLFTVSEDEIESGTSLDDPWDGETPYRDFCIDVTAATPTSGPCPPTVAEVVVPDDVGEVTDTHVTATAA